MAGCVVTAIREFMRCGGGRNSHTYFCDLTIFGAPGEGREESAMRARGEVGRGGAAK